MSAQASIPGERDHPALAFVNSLHSSRTGQVDHIATHEGLAEWLAWRGLTGREASGGGAAARDAGGAARDAAPATARVTQRDAASAAAGAGDTQRDAASAAADSALAEAVRLRAAIRELLLAAIEGRIADAAAVAAVNDAAAAAPSASQVRWAAAGPARARSASGAGDVERAFAALAEDAIELVCDHRRELIACGAPGCVRLLLRDHPRRHWCSTRCGDRVRAARHYRRSRGAPSTGPLTDPRD